MGPLTQLLYSYPWAAMPTDLIVGDMFGPFFGDAAEGALN
jgi:hypothetical protein